MKTNNSFYTKVLFFTLAAFIVIFWGSHSFGYEWSKTFGGSSRDEGNSVQQTTDGGYIIAGGGERSDGDLIKTDEDGNEQWSKTYSCYYSCPANSVQQTTDGGYIVVGTHFGHDDAGDYSEIYLSKTDEDGNELWDQRFGNGCVYYNHSSVQQTTDGGYIVVGSTNSDWAGGDDVYLIKTDTDGKELWSKTFGGSEDDEGRSVQQTIDGGYIIAGITSSLGAGGSDAYLIKTDAGGNKQWSKTFGGSEDDEGRSVQQTIDGGYIIAGITSSLGAGGSDAYLIKTDADGNKQWSKTFGGSEDDEGRSVQQTIDGGYIIAGIKGTFGAGDVPFSVAIGDLNGDGDPDLAVANYGSNNVSVLLGNGDGTFQKAVNYGAGNASRSVAIGDLNGDGDPDLAVAGSDNVSVLLGNGDGSFQSAVNYDIGDDSWSVAIGDLNGDGDLDLAVANLGSDTVSVLLGNGDGSFQAAMKYDTGGNSRSVAIDDLNGDGDLDLAVANSVSYNVSVLLGNGDGTFQSPVKYGAGFSQHSVAIGDLNGDGDLDLAVATYRSNVSVLLGNGDGSFQSAVDYGAGCRSPYSVAIGDLNGDGDLDLAVAGYDNVSVLLGNGDGTFEAAVNYGAGGVPYSVAIGDLNGDGDPDLAVANNESDNVSVLLGNGAGSFQSAVYYGVGGGSDVYLIKTDADGNQMWSKTFGGSSRDEGNSVQQTTDGGYIIVGTTYSFGAGNSDVYLIYYKPGDYVNNHVTFEPDPSTFAFTSDTTGCQTGAVGKFSFDATLTNISEKELSNLEVEVDELTNDNLLLTNNWLIGEGGRFEVPKIDDYADEYLSTGEYVDVPFTVCLKIKKPFRFFVNVAGVAAD